MIPASEWKFFEAVEQRIRHLARHGMENEIALRTGLPLSTDPAELSGRLAGIAQEQDFPARLEQALAMDPTPEQLGRLRALHRWALATLFETHPDIAPLAQELRERRAAFRPRVAGREVTHAQIRRILAEEPEGAIREEAWKATAPLGEAIQPLAAELLRRRELLARTVAGTGFPEIAFHILELDRSESVGLLDAVERYTRGAYQQAKREIRAVLGLQEVAPWDMDYGLMRLSPLPPDAFGRPSPLDAVHAQARRWGFDPQAAGLRWEPCDLPFEVRVLPMEIPGAIRLLHAPLEGHEGHRKAFRAAGRALFAARARAGAGPADADSSLAALTAGAVFESVTRDPVWLAELTGAPPPALRAHLRALRFTRILALRRHAAAAAFENMAYAAADLDPQRLHAAVEEQMLEQIRRQEVRWPADPFWVERPMFHAAAILAELGAAQLLDRMREKFPAPAGDPGAGEWLRARLFDADHALDGPALVEAAAGGPLGLGAFAQENDLTMEPAALAPVDEISDEAVAEYFKDIDLSDLDRS